MRESASPCGSQRPVASGREGVGVGVGVGGERWTHLALTSISSRGDLLVA